MLPLLNPCLFAEFDLVLQGGAPLPERGDLSLLLVQGRLQHDPVPLRVSTFLLELVHLFSEVVVGLLNHAQSAAETLILPHAALYL